MIDWLRECMLGVFTVLRSDFGLMRCIGYMEEWYKLGKAYIYIYISA
jgi:hypothetical protein